MDAFNFVKKRRPIIFPNFGFQKQLMEFEKQLEEKYKIRELRSKILNEETKVSIDRKEESKKTSTPYTKRDKAASNDRNIIEESPPSRTKKLSGQVKPTQFHYP